MARLIVWLGFLVALLVGTVLAPVAVIPLGLMQLVNRKNKGRNR